MLPAGIWLCARRGALSGGRKRVAVAAAGTVVDASAATAAPSGPMLRRDNEGDWLQTGIVSWGAGGRRSDHRRLLPEAPLRRGEPVGSVECAGLSPFGRCGAVPFAELAGEVRVVREAPAVRDPGDGEVLVARTGQGPGRGGEALFAQPGPQ